MKVSIGNACNAHCTNTLNRAPHTCELYHIRSCTYIRHYPFFLESCSRVHTWLVYTCAWYVVISVNKLLFERYLFEKSLFLLLLVYGLNCTLRIKLLSRDLIVFFFYIVGDFVQVFDLKKWKSVFSEKNCVKVCSNVQNQ